MTDLHEQLAHLIEVRHVLGMSPRRMVRAWLRSKLICFASENVVFALGDEDVYFPNAASDEVLAAIYLERKDWRDRR